MGQYAHRDGYNVLYGDWSAKWYGDPQRRLMWWECSTGVPYQDDLPAFTQDWVPNAKSLNRNCIYNGLDFAGDEPYNVKYTASYNMTSSVDAWHLFDVAAGVDGD